MVLDGTVSGFWRGLTLEGTATRPAGPIGPAAKQQCRVTPGPQRAGKHLPLPWQVLRTAGAGAPLRGLWRQWSSCTLVVVSGADPVDRLVPLNQRAGSVWTMRETAGFVALACAMAWLA